jgi:hypothetical protein
VRLDDALRGGMGQPRFGLGHSLGFVGSSDHRCSSGGWR